MCGAFETCFCLVGWYSTEIAKNVTRSRPHNREEKLADNSGAEPVTKSTKKPSKLGHLQSANEESASEFVSTLVFPFIFIMSSSSSSLPSL